MCDSSKDPHLRTYTVRFAPFYGIDLDNVRVDAQGFDETDDGHLVMWRYLPAGERQVVARFRSASVVDVFEDADPHAPDSVPEAWARTYASHKGEDPFVAPAPPLVSDDDVPF